jgi:hypothetical protein
MDPEQNLEQQDDTIPTDGEPALESEPTPAPEPAPVPERRTPEHIPYERFSQVYGENKRWKEFGEYETVKERLARLEQYEQQLEQYRRSQQQQAQPSEEELAKQRLYELAPELREIQTLREMTLRMNMERASTYLTDLLKTHSITVDPELQDDIEDFLEKKMNAAERSAFYAGDVSVVKKVFDSHFSRSGLLAALKPKPTIVPPKPPVRHSPTAGTTPPKPAAKKPMTADEAADRAWARLNGEKGD